MWSQALPWPKKWSGPEMREALRSIPSTDRCLKALPEADPALGKIPQSLLKGLVRAYWEGIRMAIKKGSITEDVDLQKRLPDLLRFVHKNMGPALRPVLNGTGIILHTNLGRALLADEACEAVSMAARNYCNLELDLETGTRGSRLDLIAPLLRRVTGAEDALIVNNNAAAVLLVLDTLCAGGETIVSRGELVEIGGSFRIPDIMGKSGAILKEVGTTNRTRLEDYSKAIGENTRAIMRVHASNFRIIGFHEAVALKDLKALAKEHGLPLIVDLGSGNLLDFSESGLPYEPTAQEVLAQGADLVCFSGDKVLGGPQAGIIAGKADMIGKLKKNPLMRALRCDKLRLAALEATLRLYLDPEKAKKKIPAAAMITITGEQLARNARALASRIRRAFAAAHISCHITLLKAISQVGGGSFPEYGLPTTLVCLRPGEISSQELRDRLLKSDSSLIGRMEKDAFCLDPRTLSRKDYGAVARSLVKALSGSWLAEDA